MEPEFTGERYVPSLKGQIYYEHLHRYVVAERACVGKRVLDVACGEGYGAAYLARSAASVLGVDIDSESIANASRRYYHDNLRFLSGSVTNLPLLDASVDVITCFETIEHLAEQEEMLAEFHRVLAPGGLLYISSPNKLVYSDKAEYQNPFHVSELYYEEFRDLLLRHFRNVAIYGQRLAASSVLHPLGGTRSELAGWYTGDLTEVKMGLPTLRDPVYFLAVCGFSDLPSELASAFIDADDDLLDHIRHDMQIEMVAADGVAPTLGTESRVIVACAPKSGSTYVANVLARYLDVRLGNAELSEVQWEAEQNLNRALLAELRGGSYVLHMHLKPYPINLRLASEFGIELMLQWRNLGDMIVSLDEHIGEFSEEQPLCYIHDKAGFVSLPAQTRYQYLINNALQWYLGFYLGWRKLRRAFSVYERMVADPLAYFSEILARLGRDVDATRLSEILASPSGFTRLNVGRVGRSAELFSEETRRLLEDIVLRDPWSGELEILLWELPWDVPALDAVTEYDGSIVAAPNESSQYFVSRGVRRLIPFDSGSWLASRSRLRDLPVRLLSVPELEAIPVASPLH